MKIAVFGLAITSSWGNGHAVTWRSLLRGAHALGHEITFYERDQPWYARHRDLTAPEYCRVRLQPDLRQALADVRREAKEADCVIVGSYVPDGPLIMRELLAGGSAQAVFYDIDTPITLAALEKNACTYMEAGLIPGLDLYLSFTGGEIPAWIEKRWGARMARTLYCCFEPELYFPPGKHDMPVKRFDLSYMGTHAADREEKFQELLLRPARILREMDFIVAGALYAPYKDWPPWLQHMEHLAPEQHREFYCQSRWTLNLTREAMTRAGYSPSVRLFEAAACATPIISDRFPGLETLFQPDEEILIADTAGQIMRILTEYSPEECRRIGDAAAERVRERDCGKARAAELMRYCEAARRPSSAAA